MCMKEEKEKDWRKERGKREDETIAHERSLLCLTVFKA